MGSSSRCVRHSSPTRFVGVATRYGLATLLGGTWRSPAVAVVRSSSETRRGRKGSPSNHCQSFRQLSRLFTFTVSVMASRRRFHFHTHENAFLLPSRNRKGIVLWQRSLHLRHHPTVRRFPAQSWTQLRRRLKTQLGVLAEASIAKARKSMEVG